MKIFRLPVLSLEVQVIYWSFHFWCLLILRIIQNEWSVYTESPSKPGPSQSPQSLFDRSRWLIKQAPFNHRWNRNPVLFDFMSNIYLIKHTEPVLSQEQYFPYSLFQPQAGKTEVFSPKNCSLLRTLPGGVHPIFEGVNLVQIDSVGCILIR